MKVVRGILSVLLLVALGAALGVVFAPRLMPEVAQWYEDSPWKIQPAMPVMAEDASGASGAREQQAASAAASTLTVSGEGVVSIEPDMATVSLGITKIAPTVSDAQSKVNVALTYVVEELKRQDIAQEDIQTDYVSIYPNYTYDTGRDVLSGYNAATTLTVIVRDIDKAGSVIDAAVSAGANRMDGITLGARDATGPYREAMAGAVRDAVAKAEALAAATGGTLGNVRIISEGSQSGAMPLSRAMGKEAMMDSAAPTQIQVGQLAITAIVTMEFELIK